MVGEEEVGEMMMVEEEVGKMRWGRKRWVR